MPVTETSYFFDTVGGPPGDRVYSAAQFADWLYQAMHRQSGVFPDLDLALAPSNSGNNVLIQNGIATLLGRIYELAGGPMTLTPSLPASGFQRRDAIVIRFDPVTNRAANLLIIAGSAVANPGPATAPAIVAGTDVYVCDALLVNTAGSTVTTVFDMRTFATIGNSTAKVQAADPVSLQDVATKKFVLNLTSLDLTSGSPYSLAANNIGLFQINATTNPYIVNLPQASTCDGYRVKIVNTSAAANGLIKIVPFAGDKIGPMAANVAAYLQNVDQSGWMNQQQTLELISNGTSWVVAGGQLNPEPGSIDAAGSQYFLGKLHHLPLGNTTSRYIVNGSVLPSSLPVWSSAIQATGVCGVPVGAKAVRIKVAIVGATGFTGSAGVDMGFAESTANIPSYATSHPLVGWGAYVVPGQTIKIYAEIDVPLNSAGQFYLYWANSAGFSSGNLYIAASGYYMGD